MDSTSVQQPVWYYNMDIHGARHAFSKPVLYYYLFLNVFYLNATEIFLLELKRFGSIPNPLVAV